MFEQEVPAEGRLELDLRGCRGEVEIVGHDVPQLRVVAVDPTTEYQVSEESKRFTVEAAGPIRVDAPREATIHVVAAPRTVRVRDMVGDVTIARGPGEQEWAETAATASAVAREMSEVGRRLGEDLGRLGRDLGDQFARAMGAWDRMQPRGPGQAGQWASRVEEFARRAEEQAERFARRAQERAERAAERAEVRAQRRSERLRRRVRRRSARGAGDTEPAPQPRPHPEPRDASGDNLEERIAVLKMLQEGKISSEEASRLLAALER